jgi:hypothetical protein
MIENCVAIQVRDRIITGRTIYDLIRCKRNTQLIIIKKKNIRKRKIKIINIYNKKYIYIIKYIIIIKN